MSARKTGFFADLDRRAKAERAAAKRVRDAAPELLAALKAFVRLPHGGECDLPGECGECLMCAARAAIAKATGVKS